LRNNPLARKPLYRSTIIRRLPTMSVIDGKEVTLDERDKAEQLFASAPDPTMAMGAPAVYYYSDGKGGIVEKMPMKMHSLMLGGGIDNSGGGNMMINTGGGPMMHPSLAMGGQGPMIGGMMMGPQGGGGVMALASVLGPAPPAVITIGSGGQQQSVMAAGRAYQAAMVSSGPSRGAMTMNTNNMTATGMPMGMPANMAAMYRDTKVGGMTAASLALGGQPMGMTTTLKVGHVQMNAYCCSTPSIDYGMDSCDVCHDMNSLVWVWVWVLVVNSRYQ
jgi:hypothetical protein